MKIFRENFAWYPAAKDRSEEIVFIIQRPDRRVLLITKKFYPTGIYKLPSGGIERKENLENALRREVYEETGLKDFDFEKIAEIHYSNFKSHLFLIPAPFFEPQAIDKGEHISNYKWVTVAELADTVKQLKNIIDKKFAAWGKFRAISHRIASELLFPANKQ